MRHSATLTRACCFANGLRRAAGETQGRNMEHHGVEESHLNQEKVWQRTSPLQRSSARHYCRRWAKVRAAVAADGRNRLRAGRHAGRVWWVQKMATAAWSQKLRSCSWPLRSQAKQPSACTTSPLQRSSTRHYLRRWAKVRAAGAADGRNRLRAGRQAAHVRGA